MLEDFKSLLKSTAFYAYAFLRWVIIALITGTAGGLVGTAFHKCVEYATELRNAHDWLILFMPLGGIIIVFLYRISKMTKNNGTDRILDAIRTNHNVPGRIAPLIFISTVITHLVGGSAGREGAALQLGGSIACKIGKICRLNEKDMHIVIMCGMSGVFSALFGTPLTATFFAMEVISVGILYYAGLVPCIISSVIGYKISIFFGMMPTAFNIPFFPEFTALTIIKVSIIALGCAVLSMIFCTVMHKTRVFLKLRLRNEYIRIVVGSLVLIALTYLIGNRDYNGSGMNIITAAIENGSAKHTAFILKIIFTALTIECGFKGGEIVPTFFIGATFGCFLAQYIGIEPGFGAAVGLVAMFCGVLNCPFASVMLSVELFGAHSLILFAVAVGVSYMLSGYFGLYASQKIMYSKTTAEFINKNAE